MKSKWHQTVNVDKSFIQISSNCIGMTNLVNSLAEYCLKLMNIHKCWRKFLVILYNCGVNLCYDYPYLDGHEFWNCINVPSSRYKSLLSSK